MTEYVVLMKSSVPGDETWTLMDGTVQARSAKSALKEKLAGEGEYVAIPARSWKPVTVKVETKTALRFS